MRYRIGQQNRLDLFRRTANVAPVNEIIRRVRLWTRLAVSVEICQQGAGHSVPLIGDQVTKRLQLVVGHPLGEFS